MNATYENAPATLLLATHCAACGRALLDAVSVEAGMGPDCREKYGYGEAQNTPDFERALACLATFTTPVAEVLVPGDAHATANKLVNRAARGLDAGACIAAIDALGFKTLAAKLGARIHAVRVEQVDGVLVVHAPFSAEFNEAVRSVPGQRFVKEGKKAWRTVPVSSRAALWAALKRAFPTGTMVLGTKGATAL